MEIFFFKIGQFFNLFATLLYHEQQKHRNLINSRLMFSILKQQLCWSNGDRLTKKTFFKTKCVKSDTKLSLNVSEVWYVCRLRISSIYKFTKTLFCSYSLLPESQFSSDSEVNPSKICTVRTPFSPRKLWISTVFPDNIRWTAQIKFFGTQFLISEL